MSSTGGTIGIAAPLPREVEISERPRAGGGVATRRAWRRIVPYAGSAAALVLFAGALFLLHGKVTAYRVEDVAAALSSLASWQVPAAIALSAVCYILLTFYDVLALRHIGKRVSYPRTALAAYTSYAFVHSFGFGSLLHATIRYRLYVPLGLRTGDIAEVTAFVNITFMIGLGVVFLPIALADPAALEGLGMPRASVVAFGVGALAIAIGYVAAGLWLRRPLVLFGHPVKIPRPRMAVAQITLSLADLGLAAGVLYLCLPGAAALGYPHLLAIFVVAQTAAIISHVPGGLGVFDTIILVGLSDLVAGDAILAGLLVFRVVYFLLPLLVAGALFGTVEAMRARRRLARASQTLAALIAPSVPLVLAGCAFVAGTVLLFSNALPERMRLPTSLPLPLVDASHFVGSIVGVLLLLLIDRLQRRSHTAWILALVLLFVGAGAALLKGFDWIPAVLLGALFLVLLVARDEFHQRSSLVADRFTPGWFLAVGVVLGSAFWLGLFSYKHVHLGDALWWQFALYGDEPRFLRASVAVAVIALAAALRILLASRRSGAAPSDGAALVQAAEIVAQAPEARANMALLGDMALLFHPAADSFIAYRVSRRSWIAFGDPVGPFARWHDLFCRFAAEARRHGGRPVFFGLGEEGARIARRLGLAVRKIGEHALVPLDAFSLDRLDPALRRSYGRLAALGCRFEVLEPGDAARPATHRRFEKFPLAVVRLEAGVVAYASLWSAAGKTELSIDAMRRTPDAPDGVLDFLLVAAALRAKAEGYAAFNLGLTPLRALDRRHARSRWFALGAVLYRHGEHYAGFAALRRAKSRFAPVWEPRFVSSPPGLALARAFPDLAALVREERNLPGVG